MTSEQREDLMIEWSIYDNAQKNIILQEYETSVAGEFSENNFLSFLREKLEVDGYWEKVGLN